MCIHNSGAVSQSGHNSVTMSHLTYDSTAVSVIWRYDSPIVSCLALTYLIPTLILTVILTSLGVLVILL